MAETGAGRCPAGGRAFAVRPVLAGILTGLALIAPPAVASVAAPEGPPAPEVLFPADTARIGPISPRDSSVAGSAVGEPAEAVRTGRAPRPAYGFPGAPLLLQFPLADWPYAFDHGRSAFPLAEPSMRQSLLWSAAYTQLGVQSLVWAWERNARPGAGRELGTWLSLGAFSFLSAYSPLGDSWLHEEWHRAVLARRGSVSRNGVYDFDIGASVIKVDGVRDADLARMKERHPADFVRLMSAGLEGQVESYRLMRRNNFFLGRSSRHDSFLWFVGGINGTFYLWACAEGWIDGDISDMERRETSMADRDFTGPDFTAWVHDLRRPEAAYDAGPRGRAHPSGAAGFRRYLASDDLTGGERDYLRLQAGLSLLNFASPQYWGHDWMPGSLPWGGPGLLWNAALIHHLTPFGFSLGSEVFLRQGKWCWILGVQGLVNAGTALPGLSAELFRYPLAVGRRTLFLTGGASAWLQPEDLLFRTDEVKPGGAVVAGIAVPVLGGLEAWMEGDAKTDGWVPGNVYLDAAAQARAGLQWRL
jgi:hypothetical protein